MIMRYTAVPLLLALFFAGCSSADLSSTEPTLPRKRQVSQPDTDPEERLQTAEGKPILPDLGEDAALSDYLRYAALNNPGLEAAFYRWQAALEQVPQAEGLPDPRLTYQYYIEEVETRVGPQRHNIGVSQMFPWFGKLDLQGKIAAEMARQRRQEYEQGKYALFYDVQETYSEYYYLGQAIRILEDNITLLSHVEEVSRAQYRTGTTANSNVIKAQVELGKLEDRLRSLRELAAPLRARLNAALNRSVNADIPFPETLEMETLELSDEEVIALSMDANPELLAFNHQILMNQKQIALAKKQYYPDITLGMNYIDTGSSPIRPEPRDSGKDPVIAMVSLNIPLWTSKYDAAVRQARANYWASRRDRENLENRIASDLKTSLYEVHDAARKVRLYRDTLLPKAVETYQVTEADYLTGKADFLDIIDAQRILLEFQLELQRALANHKQGLGRLEMLVGEKLPLQVIN